MVFKFTDRDGDKLSISPTTRDDGEQVIAISTDPAPHGWYITVHVPLARVEEVVAGIRDAARQTAGQPAAEEPLVLPRDAAEAVHTALGQLLATPAAEQPRYGVDGCTCRPWTNRGGGARWCTPDDTIDMVAGWDPGPGCPRHPAAGLAAPTNHDTETRARESIENLWNRATPVGPLLDAYRDEVALGMGRDVLRDGLVPFLIRLVGEPNATNLLAAARAAILNAAADKVWALADRTSEAGLGALGTVDLLRRLAAGAES